MFSLSERCLHEVESSQNLRARNSNTQERQRYNVRQRTAEVNDEPGIVHSKGEQRVLERLN